MPDGIAAVIATIFLSASASAISALANTAVYCGALATGLDCLPVTTSNFTTPWYLSALASAGAIALALLGDDMDQDRLVELAVARVLQHRQQMVEIVTVDRADIVEAQLVEQRAAGHEAAREFLGALAPPFPAAWAALSAKVRPRLRRVT